MTTATAALHAPRRASAGRPSGGAPGRARRRSACPRARRSSWWPAPRRRRRGERPRAAAVLGDRRGQRAVERVPRPGGVDRIDDDRRDVLGRLVGDEQRAGRADRHDHRVAHAGPVGRCVEQRAGRPGDVERRRAGQRGATASAGIGGGQGEQLAPVRADDVGRREDGPVDPVRRGRVEHRPGAVVATGAQRLANRCGRELVADEHDVTGVDADPVEGGLHGRRLERRVGAGRDRDEVLALAIDQDQGDAGRRLLERGEERDVDAVRGEGGPGLGAEVVVAHGPDEQDRPPEPRRGHGLVPALAAVVALEDPAGDGLAGRREPLAANDQVDVDRADDDDPSAAHRPVMRR